ncbi:MAG: hypothetical protein IJN95_03590 [Clostridia bacterium]|nr:hypothetical protein [Clostridia bacterium]
MEILLFIFVCIISIPIGLTIFNIIFLFKEEKFKVKTVNLVDLLIFGLGIPLTALLIDFSEFVEWNVPVYFVNKFSEGGTYTPISFESLPTVIILSLVAFWGYLLPRVIGKWLSPVIAALCYSGMFIGVFLTVAITVQLGCDLDNFNAPFLLVLPWNYVICSIRLMKKSVREFSKNIAERNYKNKFLQFCKVLLSKSASFMVISFLLVFPLLLILITILTLFGQQPDSIIKAFTETAEWTLSQKIPPPRLDYHGHYLCTVAACGDERVVKPVRAGKRGNRLIVVNRQLLIANAFEDLIAEKLPKTHKIIRKTYDKIGLPISKHITTKRRSNLVYFIMKPLEWLFIFVLYTFDLKPENRINSQYLG